MNKISLSSILVACILLPTSPAIAGSSVWQSSPPTSDWNTATNWTPNTVPNGSADVATFAFSAITGVSTSAANTEVNGITFNAGASAFTITIGANNQLTISGTGITNNSGITQNFVTPVSGNADGTISFTNSATAGALTAFTNNGVTVNNRLGSTSFQNSSSAGSGTFTNNGATVSGANSGFTSFSDTSTAGSGTFINNGGTVSGASGGELDFNNSSIAMNGTFTTNGGTVSGAFGGTTAFGDTSTAGNGTFTTNGATVSGASGGLTQFLSGATAANGTFTINAGAVSGANGGGLMLFVNTSTAGNGTFTLNGATVSGAQAGTLGFESTATAGNGTFTTNGGTASGASGGVIKFNDSNFAPFAGTATAGNGTFTNNGGTVSGAFGGATEFFKTSTAGSGIFTNNGGTVSFDGSSSGGSAFIQNKSGGVVNLRQMATADGLTIVNESGAKVDISDSSSFASAGVGVGSLSGAGNVFLGNRNLILGALDQNDTISGVIADGGANGGTSGSLTKTSTGIHSLTNANTYSGGTFINGGTLIAAHDGALGGGNVSLTASCVTLTLQNGPTNNYIADAASLSIVRGSTVNLDFTGTPDTIGSLIVDGVAQAPGLYGSAASGAPNQLPEFTGAGQVLVTLGAGQGLVTPASQLLNISTRMRVLTGDNVLIGGFIITGCDAKKVIIRGIGPSLNGVGVTLSDPTLELHQGSTTLATNDNWKIDDQTGQSQQAEIEATTIPPKNDLESAIVMTLSPGAYTAILAGKNGGTGVGVVEVYDLDQAANSKLANISTRGFVDTGNNVMIGGLIVGGSGGGSAKVIVRALGPSVPAAGVLGDPTLELHDGSGTTIATNDNWKIDDQTGQSQQAEIEATTIPPKNDLESALVATLAPGNYTAIVRGAGNTTGVGLVEVYNLQ